MDSNISAGFETETRSGGCSSFRVMQWNILADGLAQFGDFVRVSAELLEWNTRAPKLLDKIVETGADLVCLQELNHYEDFFLPQMQQRGFDGIFNPKSSSPASRYDFPPDGCAVFFKSSKFLLEEEVRVRVGEINHIGACRIFSSDLNSACVLYTHAIICRLQNVQTNQELVLATTHLKAKAGDENDAIRARQVQELLEASKGASSLINVQQQAVARMKTTRFSCLRLETISIDKTFLSVASLKQKLLTCTRDGRLPSVVCGDFNTNPHSAVYGLMRNHCLNFQSVYACSVSDLASDDNLRLIYLLSDGLYEAGAESEPPFTTWKFRPTGEKQETIDYIWFADRQKLLTPLCLWRLPDVTSIGVDGLPSEAMPSDHLPLLSEFTWKKEQPQSTTNHVYTMAT